MITCSRAHSCGKSVEAAHNDYRCQTDAFRNAVKKCLAAFKASDFTLEEIDACNG
ncbi:hypothetical protein KXD93_06960 [Mucilaginibacter sp. BJC16-A38]|uniref:hypothetical protein n=1 Tax=Mucilaginibacter phenanthrenivorans TaxID=1234842 RepID=UPI0021579D18|nr:hypothetical protein [Mucilaginibacter phenanthrenivorans]MCR8557374.1 hypothetical protein [Mucilaginibacter phenanthrenivorans]